MKAIEKTDGLKDDKEFCMEAIEKNGDIFQLASTILRDDKDVVMKAIGENGCNFEYASDWLKVDMEVVRKAADNHYVCALEYALDRQNKMDKMVDFQYDSDDSDYSIPKKTKKKKKDEESDDPSPQGPVKLLGDPEDDTPVWQVTPFQSIPGMFPYHADADEDD